MTYAPGYPIQIQADNQNAEDSRARAMCQVYDKDGFITVFDALTKSYLHVIAWDSEGKKVKEYNNR